MTRTDSKIERYNFWSTLHISNWEKATEDEKLGALQKLEDHYAKLQNRDPAFIEVNNDLPNNIEGLVDHANGGGAKIEIHPALLKNRKPYRVVYNILHEGRHVYQRAAWEKPEIIAYKNNQEVEVWKINSTKQGYLIKMPDNPLQPVELDADSYARKEIESIYGELEKIYGENKEFDGFKGYKKRELEARSDLAKQIHGENYLEVIREKVGKKHKLVDEFIETYFDDFSSEDALTVFFLTVEDFIDKYPGDVSLRSFEESWENYPEFTLVFQKERENNKVAVKSENVPSKPKRTALRLPEPFRKIWDNRVRRFSRDEIREK